MEKLPAATGLLWIKQGFALFRKRPAEVSMLFLAYMFLMLALGIIPLLGQVLPLMLVPAFSLAFLQACVNIEQGKRITPGLLLTGFRSAAVANLLKLGVAYLLAAIVVVGASSLIDGGVFWSVITGQTLLDAKTVQDSDLASAMLFSALLYVPVSMAFWYAAPLVAWHQMGVAKALFYSFFAVSGAARPFLVYGLGWGIIGIVFPAVVSLLAVALLGGSVAVMAILMPLSVALTIIMYCSFYPTYTAVFGTAEVPPAA
ncbi:BPSS1780 family membrane protein [Herminiimonas sp. CN]|uniref:BPSS1780 family membrane protein n=1 Tax=Herminiimonas sp. CN TaxID=1349818 RepID=UPI0004733B84|nr:BPSS1780 family membrane protein [Herminiimonas sp. CN]